MSAKQQPLELVDVTAGDVGRRGFFCYMSKKKSEGYQRKLRWLEARFAEGLRLKLLPTPERGFIEYLPGEYAWRAVSAEGYLFIHCLWVVGKSKSQGHSATLLEAYLADARKQKLKGLAMVTSERVWLAGRRVLERHGFERVDTAPELPGPDRPGLADCFSLMVKKLGKHPSPSFTGNWEKKARAFGEGLTVLRSDQCPYVVDATAAALGAAKDAGCPSRVVEWANREELAQASPSPYGVFGLVLDGRLESYHYLLAKDLAPRLAAR